MGQPSDSEPSAPAAAGSSAAWPVPPPSRMLVRGLVRHCPRCGSGRLFRGYFHMVDRCPKCGYLFDREEGFWLGAFVVNFAVAEGVLALLIGGFILREAATQDTGGTSVVPWIAVGLVLAVLNPILFYPFSKTIWTAIDLIMHAGKPGPDARR